MTVHVILLCALSLLCIGFLLAVNYRHRIRYKHLSSLMQTIPVNILLFNPQKVITNIYNRELNSIHGYSTKDIVGKHISTFINNPNSPFCEACVMINASLDRIKISHENEKFCYNIQDTYLEAITSIMDNGYMVCVVNDITQSTKDMAMAMKKKQNEIAVAINAGGLTSWSYDVATQLLNSESNNEVIHKNTSFDELMSNIEPGCRAAVRNAFTRILNHKTHHAEFTVKVTNRNGKMIWTNVHAVLDEYNEDGSVKTIIGSQKNITKEVNKINELIRLRKKAEEADKLKSAFLANMSHEIRTPLNAIVGFSELITTTRDPEEQEEYAQIIEHNNSILLAIINDIMDLSKIESDTMSYIMENIDVPVLLNSLAKSTALKVDNNVEMVLDKIGQDIKLKSDSNRISQVVSNFLNNAAKFTTVGSIHLGCRKLSNEQICIYVKDTGIGIAEENQERIFDRFVKLNNFVQGTGLGLPICKTIANDLGGTVGVKSEIGQGSVFWISIPQDYQIKTRPT
ncbi:MAG: ATP-binding protein [Mucinivorans sp.]